VNGTVNAVVVRFRGGDEVRRCLASLIEHGGSRLRRIVLVDSGSGDTGAGTLAGEFPTVEVRALGENLGFAHAANHGAHGSNEPMLLLLNPDTEVLPGAIDDLGSLLEDRPGAVGAVPLLEGPDGTTQHRWQLRSLPTVTRLAFGLAGAPAFRRPPTSYAAVVQPAAAAWLVRRSAWDILGGLNPDYAPAWWEDVDFCARVQNRLGQPSFPPTEGFVVHPSARVRHTGGSSVPEIGEAAFLSAFNRNLLLYAAQHHPARLSLIRSTLRASLIVRGLIRPSRRRAYLAAVESVSSFETQEE
jgi:GT2 family glycosyltransferase